MERKIKNIHFIGIGGIGMSGLAEICLKAGFSVSGSDISSSKITERLKSLGAIIYNGHSEENIRDYDWVIFSSAISSDNPELVCAKKRNIPTIKRGRFLSEIIQIGKAIAICGAHGKTTTTGLIGCVLEKGGLDPTIINGGIVCSFGSNARLGKGRYIVCELDESDGSFGFVHSKIAVVTNIDREHMDYFKTMRRMLDEYLIFINQGEMAVLCEDDKYIRKILPSIKVKYTTYGTRYGALRAGNIVQKPGCTYFDVAKNTMSMGRWKINLIGRHNALNALSAISVGEALSIDYNVIKLALSEFSGIERRLEVKRNDSIMVVSDYGHHPTEIKKTLKAVKRAWKRPIIAIFQPHRYTRTKDLLDRFSTCFKDAGTLILTEIYPASEKPISGISGEVLYNIIKKDHKGCHFVPSFWEIPGFVRKMVKKGDCLLVLGAGDIIKIADNL